MNFVVVISVQTDNEALFHCTYVCSSWQSFLIRFHKFVKVSNKFICASVHRLSSRQVHNAVMKQKRHNFLQSSNKLTLYCEICILLVADVLSLALSICRSKGFSSWPFARFPLISFRVITSTPICLCTVLVIIIIIIF